MPVRTPLSILALFLLISFLISCTDGTAHNMANSRDKAASDQTSTIKEFLSWYKDNYEAINAIKIVSLAGEGDTARYKVDDNSVTAYINLLRSSGYFSERYLNSQLQYFRERDRIFSLSRQSDGVPVGFEADLLLFTQEPETLLDQAKTLPVEELDKQLYKLKAIDHSLLFGITTQNGRYVINEIGYSKK